ncbi:hypothetical protein psyc5s11_38860 [Clostridium gelidum]|uniref:DUF1722 domain-containing protein n=1 Tax=Clostridium gelidum TaxID=704125 RepID=A0ABM7T7Z3_9CLOT|nr:UV DNA damage repair endonuclease UvsE [Clostridium gelidum]BCZ47819.1 hypothetical protein psyc5s11_38860 [Clostridium gelidum]
MSIGYACLTIGVFSTNLKSCVLRNVNEEKLLDLISNNLNSLENIIDYNIKNNIKLFRISSDLIPFGSNSVNNISWWDIFFEKFQKIGTKIQENGMRVSMHPGQYTVLNSPSLDVVNRAIDDLKYHTRVLNSLGVSKANKIILHIGGVYNDKKQAINRFIDNYNNLEESIKERLVIENDDKSYNINDVLEIGTKLKIPVIFDNLHNYINSSEEEKSQIDWINECEKTWSIKDGYQKIHYSQQNIIKKPGSHSKSININEFISFYECLGRNDIDIMLEVKDKNLSAVKCINGTSIDKDIKVLEIEWSRYKYKVLESSPANYAKIRNLLKDKNNYPVIEFYNLIENAMETEITTGNVINAALHIWGYFKKNASEKEKISFLKIVDEYENGVASISKIKNSLWRMTIKYNEEYLLHSYYFVL